MIKSLLKSLVDLIGDTIEKLANIASESSDSYLDNNNVYEPPSISNQVKNILIIFIPDNYTIPALVILVLFSFFSGLQISSFVTNMTVDQSTASTDNYATLVYVFATLLVLVAYISKNYVREVSMTYSFTLLFSLFNINRHYAKDSSNLVEAVEMTILNSHMLMGVTVVALFVVLHYKTKDSDRIRVLIFILAGVLAIAIAILGFWYIINSHEWGTSNSLYILIPALIITILPFLNGLWADVERLR